MPNSSRHGFSLIEVNLAVFVMAVGILALMGLFPTGLRESMQSRADLKQTMFADYALSILQANAACVRLDHPRRVVSFENADFFQRQGQYILRETNREREQDNRPSVADMGLGSTGRDKGKYRLVKLDYAEVGLPVLFNPNYLSAVAVQSSELSAGFFRNNPIFVTALMSWNYAE